jgi:hypothetical protein
MVSVPVGRWYDNIINITVRMFDLDAIRDSSCVIESQTKTKTQLVVMLGRHVL